MITPRPYYLADSTLHSSVQRSERLLRASDRRERAREIAWERDAADLLFSAKLTLLVGVCAIAIVVGLWAVWR